VEFETTGAERAGLLCAPPLLRFMKPTLHADLRNPAYCQWRDFLRNSDSWSYAQIEEYQVREVRRLVRHAYENAAGYRDLYRNAGLNPDSIKSLSDFAQFPAVTKEMIRDGLEKFSIPTKKRSYVTTGGSTGIPFGFYRDTQSFSKELASKAHQYYRVGWKEGDRQLVFRGLPINSKTNVQFYPRFNELRCSSYYLTPEWMERYQKRALQYRPDWLRCYPSSGCIFASFLKDAQLAFPDLKGILCASENLYDFQKQLLRDVFRTRVFSHYGHYEMAVLAGFCEFEDSHHVLPQYGYAELIDHAGKPVTQPGAMGEIVGTSFIMHATPFIRYRTRDYAVLKGWGCNQCGRPYQVWARVEGRLQEFIVTNTGRPISMTAMNMHDGIFDDLVQFQFYQRNKGEVHFRYVPKTTCRTHSLDAIHTRLLSKLGSDMTVRLERVTEIPLTPRGKHRFLIQEIPLTIGDA
jgi:phenylacetate-CoA ligase